MIRGFWVLWVSFLLENLLLIGVSGLTVEIDEVSVAGLLNPKPLKLNPKPPLRPRTLAALSTKPCQALKARDL